MIKNFVTKKKTKSEGTNPLLEDMDNESMLYLSSNWSTGIMDYDAVSSKSFDDFMKSNYQKEKVKLPKLQI